MTLTRTLGGQRWALGDGSTGTCEHCHTPVTSGQKVYKLARLLQKTRSVHMSCWTEYESAQMAAQMGLGPRMTLVLAKSGKTIAPVPLDVEAALAISFDSFGVDGPMSWADHPWTDGGYAVRAVGRTMKEAGLFGPYDLLLCGSRGEIYGRAEVDFPLGFTPTTPHWRELGLMVREWMSSPQVIGHLAQVME